MRPLQIDLSGALPAASVGTWTRSAGSGFEELLDSRIGAGEGGAPYTPQGAAKVLQMEMMLRSLALAGDAQSEEQGCAEEAGAVGIEATAARYLGTPYRFGGEGPDGVDCSSFVQRVYLEHQVDLPRTAREQIRVGREVAPGELRKGDLVFFQTYASYPSHVGIYLGDGRMIHASSEKGEVTVSDMNSEYYRSRYLGAKRVA